MILKPLFFFRLLLLIPFCLTQECGVEATANDYCVGPGERYSLVSAINNVTGPGDKILIRGGTYRFTNTFYIKPSHDVASGSYENPIELRPYKNETVTLIWDDVSMFDIEFTDWWWIYDGLEGGTLNLIQDTLGNTFAPYALRIRFTEGNGATLGPFNLYCLGKAGSGSCNQMIFSHGGWEWDPLVIQGITIDGDVPYGGIKLSHVASTTPGTRLANGTRYWIHDCRFLNVRNAMIYTGWLGYLTFENNYLQGGQSYLGYGYIWIDGGYHLVFQNNIIYDDTTLSYELVYLESDYSPMGDIVFQNNLFECTDTKGASTLFYFDREDQDADGILIQNNLINMNCMGSRFLFFGGSSSYSVSNCIVRNNIHTTGSPSSGYVSGSSAPNCGTPDFIQVDFSLYGSFDGDSHKPDPFFRPLQQIVGAKYDDSPSLDFAGNSRTTFEMGPFVYEKLVCDEQRQIMPDCVVCYDLWDESTNCSVCTMLIENPEVGTCEYGRCVVDFYDSYCNMTCEVNEWWDDFNKWCCPDSLSVGCNQCNDAGDICLGCSGMTSTIGCNECDVGATECLGCVSNYFLDETNHYCCPNSIEEGCYHCDTTQSLCQACNASYNFDGVGCCPISSLGVGCDSCNHPDQNWCDSCNIAGSYFLDSVNGRCCPDNWDTQCDQCDADFSFCTHCSGTYWLDVNSRCCEDFSFNGCVECSTQNACVDCDGIDYFFDEANDKCCPIASLPVNCSSCDPTFATCTNCENLFFLDSFNHRCCPDSLSFGNSCDRCSFGRDDCTHCVANFFLDEVNDWCCPQSLPEGCDQCTFDQSRCTGCDNTEYWLHGDICCPNTLSEECTSCVNGSLLCDNCTSDHWLSSNNNHCCSNSLPSKCSECSMNGTICVDCHVGAWLSPTNMCCENSLLPYCSDCDFAGSSCSDCEDGFDFDSSSKCCSTSIDPQCMECDVDNRTKCVDCGISHWSDIEGKCCSSTVENCVLCDITGNYCEKCTQNFFEDVSGVCCNDTLDPNCNKCVSFSNPSDCVSCEGGYFLSYHDNETCCETNGLPLECNACSGATCLGCNVGFWLDSVDKCCSNSLLASGCTQCSVDMYNCSSCGDGSFVDMHENCCNQTLLDDNCNECSALGDTCLGCIGGHFLSPTENCCDREKMHAECSDCLGDNCTACGTGYWLGSDRNCCQDSVHEVASNCVMCTSSSNLCGGCSVGFDLMNSHCCSESLNSLCSDCSPNGMTCTQCVEGFLDGDSNCCDPSIDITCEYCDTLLLECRQCPTDMFVDEIDSKRCCPTSIGHMCISCSSDKSECAECNTGFELQGGSCVEITDDSDDSSTSDDDSNDLTQDNDDEGEVNSASVYAGIGIGIAAVVVCVIVCVIVVVVACVITKKNKNKKLFAAALEEVVEVEMKDFVIETPEDEAELNESEKTKESPITPQKSKKGFDEKEADVGESPNGKPVLPVSEKPKKPAPQVHRKKAPRVPVRKKPNPPKGEE